MQATHRRFALWSTLGLLLAGAVGYLLWPRPVPVDLVAVARGPLAETVAEDGQTRVRDVFVLSAPLEGRLRRIEVRAGDVVAADESVVAQIEPTDPAFLDVRSAAERQAAVETAKAARAYAEAELAQALAQLDFAAAERERARQLIQRGTISQRALDDAERTYKSDLAAVATARAAVAMRESELKQAEVRLLSPTATRQPGGNCECVPIRSPVSGRVLRVLRESEGVVAAGQPLIEIGDPAELEVVVDFLSADAVRIEAGQRAIIDGWGGAEPLRGRVARIEPYGFTKVSALGIEEQRVNVFIDFVDPPERWRRLGHGFQVDARVVLWESERALKLPLTAVFREDGQWSVFVLRDGRARLRPVTVGHRTEFEIEIVDGLAAGEVVLRYPSDRIADGTAVTRR